MSEAFCSGYFPKTWHKYSHAPCTYSNSWLTTSPQNTRKNKHIPILGDLFWVVGKNPPKIGDLLSTKKLETYFGFGGEAKKPKQPNHLPQKSRSTLGLGGGRSPNSLFFLFSMSMGWSRRWGEADDVDKWRYFNASGGVSARVCVWPYIYI